MLLWSGCRTAGAFTVLVLPGFLCHDRLSGDEGLLLFSEMLLPSLHIEWVWRLAAADSALLCYDIALLLVIMRLDSMPKIARSALVMFPAQAMYDLVNDVESYPQFLPWCENARILRKEGAQVDAALMVVKGRIRQEFSTTNQMDYGKSIHMELLDGPFSHLSGTWNFKPLGPEGCKVSLEMDFEVSSSLLKATLGPMFGQVMNTMVDAFSRRAEKVYG